MYKLNHSPLFETIKEYLNTAIIDETIYIFTPYIKTAILNKIIPQTNTKIVIITSWNTNDLLSGSSELELYPFCIENGITLYINNKIHLKFYSNEFNDGIIATGNISERGLMHDGNYECAVYMDKIENSNRMFLQNIISKSTLINDDIYFELKNWLKNQTKILKNLDYFDNIVNNVTNNTFLISALPMTYCINDLISGYAKLNRDQEPSADKEISDCIYHDLANYDIELGLSNEKFLHKLKVNFFAHPFILRIDEFIDPHAYFGGIKEWVQSNCTDVPIPSRRSLTNNIQVLYEWFNELGDGKYVIDTPGSHSQRITNTTKF